MDGDLNEFNPYIKKKKNTSSKYTTNDKLIYKYILLYVEQIRDKKDIYAYYIIYVYTGIKRGIDVWSIYIHRFIIYSHDPRESVPLYIHTYTHTRARNYILLILLWSYIQHQDTKSLLFSLTPSLPRNTT